MESGGARFSELAAEERARQLVDAGSLARLEAIGGGSASAWVGGGRIGGHEVLLALTDGRQRGGTIGVDDSTALRRWLAAAGERRPRAVIVCWDTGGVRVDEGPLALATASAVGVALARFSIAGPPVMTVVSGTRGCFGAPSVIAALSNWTIVTRGSHWGLTGPRLLVAGRVPATEEAGRAATAAEGRAELGHANALVEDSGAAVRASLLRRLDRPPRLPAPRRALDVAVARTETQVERLDEARRERRPTHSRAARGERDLLRFSFHGQWRPTGPRFECGLVHAAWGKLGAEPALGIVAGTARRHELGIGIEESHAITEMVRFAVSRPGKKRAPILVFVFCQGHAVDVEEERLGLHAALAECMRSLVAARLLGHPILSVLGGGTYGAAYLALAAPSHRILAIRGTTVAPMAPRVLAAFRKLKGLRGKAETAIDVADLIPEITIVSSVVRLPTALRTALAEIRAS